MDIVTLIITCFDLLSVIYEKLRASAGNEYQEVITRIDSRIWRNLILPVFKDIDTICEELISGQMSKLLNK